LSPPEADRAAQRPDVFADPSINNVAINSVAPVAVRARPGKHIVQRQVVSCLGVGE
jgi:hypothetical protein